MSWTMVKLLPKMRQTAADRQALAYRQLLRKEAKMGGQLFGPIPNGHNREFFCLDEHTWVWHEEWLDAAGNQQSVTTRYDVRPQGILKSQGSMSYQLVQGDELANLYRAARLYRDNLYTQMKHYNLI